MGQTPNERADRPARRRLAPIDVQQKVFRRAFFRGYHEQDVDDFLDEITEEIAMLLDEQRQLREGGSRQDPGATQELAEMKKTADEIVLRAREGAEQILRRARIEADGIRR